VSYRRIRNTRKRKRNPKSREAARRAKSWYVQHCGGTELVSATAKKLLGAAREKEAERESGRSSAKASSDKSTAGQINMATTVNEKASWNKKKSRKRKEKRFLRTLPKFAHQETKRKAA